MIMLKTHDDSQNNFKNLPVATLAGFWKLLNSNGSLKYLDHLQVEYLESKLKDCSHFYIGKLVFVTSSRILSH